MKFNKIYVKSNWYRIIILILLSLGIYLIASNGYMYFNQFTLFDDEFGYWLGSAYLMGDDWSAVAKDTSYYSYGYGFLVATPLRLFVPQTFVYNAAIQVNAILLMASFLIASYMSEKLIPQIPVIMRYLLCFLTCIYPSYIVFSHIAWSECLLVFLFWVFVWTSYRVMTKPTYLNHAIIGALSVVLYAVHQRTLAIMIATVMILFAVYTIERSKRRYLICYYIVFSVTLIGHCFIKADLLRRYYKAEPGSNKVVYALLITGALYVALLYLPKRIMGKLFPCIGIMGIVVLFVIGLKYLNSNEINTNSYVSINNMAGQIGKIKFIFTRQGFWSMMFSMSSKGLYLTISTCFLLYWGLEKCICEGLYLFKNIIRNIREKVENGLEREKVWYIWLFITFLGSFLIMALYMVIFTRVDCLLYGRYVEHMLGIYVMLGVGHFLQDRKWWLKGLLLTISMLFFGYLAAELIYQSEVTSFSPYHVAYLYHWVYKYRNYVEAIQAFTRDGLAISVVVLILIKLRSRKQIVNMAKVLIIVVALSIGYVLSANQIIDYNILKYQNTRNRNYRPIVWEIEKYHGDHSNKIYYCKDTVDILWTQIFQFLLGHDILYIIDKTEVVPDEEAFYIMGLAQTGIDGFYEKYYPIMTTEKYVLCTNRGTKLEAMIASQKSNWN